MTSTAAIIRDELRAQRIILHTRVVALYPAAKPVPCGRGCHLEYDAVWLSPTRGEGDVGEIVITRFEGTDYYDVGTYGPDEYAEGVEPICMVSVPIGDIIDVVAMLAEGQPEGTDWCAWSCVWLCDRFGVIGSGDGQR